MPLPINQIDQAEKLIGAMQTFASLASLEDPRIAQLLRHVANELDKVVKVQRKAPAEAQTDRSFPAEIVGNDDPDDFPM